MSMQSVLFKMMNDELEDLRAFKALALELANRKGFDSVNAAIESINHTRSWIDVNHELPINGIDEHGGNVLGVIAPYSDLKNATIDFVHFDGEDWYDKNSRTCTVTHWIPISTEYLK